MSARGLGTAWGARHMIRVMRRHLLIALIALGPVAALALAGCGGADQSDTQLRAVSALERVAASAQRLSPEDAAPFPPEQQLIRSVARLHPALRISDRPGRTWGEVEVDATSGTLTLTSGARSDVGTALVLVVDRTNGTTTRSWKPARTQEPGDRLMRYAGVAFSMLGRDGTYYPVGEIRDELAKEFPLNEFRVSYFPEGDEIAVTRLGAFGLRLAQRRDDGMLDVVTDRDGEVTRALEAPGE